MGALRPLAIVLVIWAAVSCGWIGGPDDEGLKLIHIDDLLAILDSTEARVTLLDANGPDFRAREGVIPGATLLTSYSRYDVTKELPSRKDARLVFYCADSH